MKKLILILTVLFISTTYAKEIESILKIKPIEKYDENYRYEDVNKYHINKDDLGIKSDFDFDIRLDINKELGTFDGFKIDIGTKF